jgi:murein DD-endopeptidase MepM/ murein hydrolase activator NlpD
MVLEGSTRAAGGAENDPARPIIDRLRAREAFLAQHWVAANEAARRQALSAYRLARRRQVGFLGDPSRRRQDAEAVDLAMTVVQRSMLEARLNKDELAGVRAERESLESNLARRTPGQPPGKAILASSIIPGLSRMFARPVPGSVVGAPGVRRDPATNAQLRQDGVRILARLNDPVRAVRKGMVRRVAGLPQGGFGVVTAHADGWVSILTGLREVTVTEGQSVDQGRILGRAGRTLDGAVVVTYSLWRNRVAIDPRSAL